MQLSKDAALAFGSPTAFFSSAPSGIRERNIQCATITNRTRAILARCGKHPLPRPPEPDAVFHDTRKTISRS